MNIIFFFLILFFMIMMLFVLMKNPLIMGLMLIFNTMFLCIYIMLYSFSSWNSYILFLMFLGGILILFLYNISLISTEIFSEFNIKKFFFMIIFFFLLLMNFYYKETFFNDSFVFFFQKEFSNLTFFFLKYNLNSILWLICYIFFSLICIVNLVYLMSDKGTIFNKM